jgi:ABC-type hemin transport system ATPase subunit
MELLRASTRDEGAAAALVLHDLTFAAICDRILMLFGDGRHAAGSAADMLQRERLEDLYGCRLRAFSDGTGVRFIPVI